MSEKKRVHFAVPPDLDEFYAEKAKKLGLTKTALYILALQDWRSRNQQ